MQETPSVSEKNAWLGRSMETLDTPVLCLDAELLEANISKMARFLEHGSVGLRPHTKTHKSPMIASLQVAAGAIGITCAKLGEAEVMVQAGLRDILIANQIVGREKVERLIRLATNVPPMVAIDNEGNAHEISSAALSAQVQIPVLVEVDVGLGRCGVQPGSQALELVRKVTSLPGLAFKGLMGYEGHTVMIMDRQERKRQAESALALLVRTRHLIEDEGFAVPIVSCGGTGTYDVSGVYPGVTEIQAGSYATMDTRYRDEVGIDYACALFVVSQVISTPKAGVAIIDAGVKALSCDFGLPLLKHPEGWRITRLSEEHGKLEQLGGAPLHIGDKVIIWPSHGCTTVNLHDEYFILRDGVVADVWPIAARGRFR